jgi:WD40-like Beta Propeller Repeat
MLSPRPAGPTARWAIATLAAIGSLAAAACTGKTHDLGDNPPRAYHFETPEIVAELAFFPFARTDNPTLTADRLEIYFTSDRAGQGDLWFARRASAGQPFGAPEPIDVLNTSTFETSSAISADGLTLWFGSDRVGGVGMTDIWVASRPNRSAGWLAPVNVIPLNTGVEDIPRPPGQHGLVMPLSSKQATSAVYQTFLAARAGAGAPFGTPVLVSELAYADRSTVDGFLTDDGLTLFFSSSPLQFPPDGGPSSDGGIATPFADLFVAWRQSTSEPFSFTQALDDLNTGGDERDPWLTADGKTLYFTSDRDGALNIYTAAVKPR